MLTSQLMDRGLDRFTVMLYHKGGEEFSVNRVRKILFTSKSRSLQSLPPTRKALRQHCLSSAYQAGQVWGRSCSVNDNIPGPEGWGWTMVAGEWKPIWSSLPSIWEACRELVKCSCLGCHQRCSCLKAKVPCTLLCTNCSEGQKKGYRESIKDLHQRFTKSQTELKSDQWELIYHNCKLYVNILP